MKKQNKRMAYNKNRHALRTCGSAETYDTVLYFVTVNCAAFCFPGDSSCPCVMCGSNTV